MALTPEHRAELEVLGPETVRIRLRSSDLVTAISGFKTPTTRSDIEGWLTEKRIEGESERRQWSWTIQAYVFASLATAVVLLSVDVKDQLLAIYSFSGVVGWLAGAIAYFCWSVLFAHQRKTKQRAVTWLPLGASVAALVGFIWRPNLIDLSNDFIHLTNEDTGMREALLDLPQQFGVCSLG